LLSSNSSGGGGGNWWDSSSVPWGLLAGGVRSVLSVEIEWDLAVGTGAVWKLNPLLLSIGSAVELWVRVDELNQHSWWWGSESGNGGIRWGSHWTIVRWVGHVGVVATSSAVLVPSVASDLVWLSAAVGVLPLGGEVTGWASGGIRGIDGSILVLSDLMLMVWNHNGRGLDHWIVDDGLVSWSVGLKSWVSGSSSGIGSLLSSSSGWINPWDSNRWTLAGGNNSIAQISGKWDDLTGRSSVSNSVWSSLRSHSDKLLAVWQLNPSGSDSRS